VFGIKLDGNHDTVENCTVTNCSEHGIFCSGSYNSILKNYVDAIGGEVVDDGTGIGRDNLEHDLYVGGSGLDIEGNFFGRALSGDCAHLLCWGSTATTVFSNNVCYGGQSDAATLAGGNITATGNVLIAPQLYWRGYEVTPYPLSTNPDNPDPDPGGAPIGLKLFLPQSNVVVSGNYIEGAYIGLDIWGWGGPAVQVSGMAITHNTIVGNSATVKFDGLTQLDYEAALGNDLPSVMNANNWGWVNGSVPGVFVVQNQTYGYGSSSFNKWATQYGFEQQSAGSGGWSLIATTKYDGDLDTNDEPGSTTSAMLAYAMTDFRGWATGRIAYGNTSYGAAASGPDGIDGKAPSTFGGDGTAPQLYSATLTYPVTAGTPLSVSALAGLLYGVQDPDGYQLALAVAQYPACGTVTVNADGSFVYVPGLDFSGSDTFLVQVSDGNGGTALETVNLELS
jgi:parallel beta-helix repeat protein